MTVVFSDFSGVVFAWCLASKSHLPRFCIKKRSKTTADQGGVLVTLHRFLLRTESKIAELVSRRSREVRGKTEVTKITWPSGRFTARFRVP